MSTIYWLAFEVADGVLWGALVTVVGGASKGAQVLWQRHQKERERRAKEVARLFSEKDAEIARLNARLVEVADGHGAKIEELMGRQVQLLDRVLGVLSDFTAAVKSQERMLRDLAERATEEDPHAGGRSGRRGS